MENVTSFDPSRLFNIIAINKSESSNRLPKLPSNKGISRNIRGKSNYLVKAFNFLKNEGITSDELTLLNEDLKILQKMITDSRGKDKYLNEKRAAKIISLMVASFKDPVFVSLWSMMKTANFTKSQIKNGEFWNYFSEKLCSQAKLTNVHDYKKLIDLANEFYDNSTVKQYKEFLEALWSNWHFSIQGPDIEALYNLLFTKKPAYLEGLDDWKSVRNTFLRQTREADDIRLLQYFFDEETRSITPSEIKDPSFNGALFRSNTGFTRLLGDLGSKYGRGIHESLENILTSSQLESEMVDLLKNPELKTILMRIVDTIINGINANHSLLAIFRLHKGFYDKKGFSSHNKHESNLMLRMFSPVISHHSKSLGSLFQLIVNNVEVGDLFFTKYGINNDDDIKKIRTIFQNLKDYFFHSSAKLMECSKESGSS